MARHIVALVGSNRPGGTVDSAVDAILAGAAEQGAQVRKILLSERPLEFCRGCRQCTRNPGPGRGACVIQDGLAGLLAELDAADALVLAAPVHFYNVTALFRRFLERLVCYAYWPLDRPGPVLRERLTRPNRPAVLVTAAAMPGLFIPLATGAPRALRVAAETMGARATGTLWLGLTGAQAPLAPAAAARGRRLGARLARG